MFLSKPPANHTVAAIAVLLAGCATQTYTPKPIEPAESMAAFQARTLADAQLGEISSWGLAELTRAALRLHPDLDLARAQWRAAQAAQITAGQKPNPTLSTSGEHHSRHQGVSPWTLNLGIEIPVETAHKREIRVAQATALSEAARLEIAQTAWNVRSRVRARLLDLYAIRQQVAQLQREQDLRQKIVALLEARVRAGLAANPELSEARLEWQKVRMLLDAEASREAEARAALAAAIGIPDEALEGVTFSFDAFEQIPDRLPPREVQRAALLNRIDIRKALAQYEAAEAKLRLEIARQHPDFNLSPGISWDQNDFKWSLGLSLLLAMIGNKNEGPIAEANAAREVAAAQFTTLQARVIGEQAQAQARWQSALDDITKARRLVAAQASRLAQVQRQFDLGYADRLELTAAQLAVVGAESAVLAARLKSLRALGALEDTVQQPLDGSADAIAIPDEDSSA